MTRPLRPAPQHTAGGGGAGCPLPRADRARGKTPPGRHSCRPHVAARRPMSAGRSPPAPPALRAAPRGAAPPAPPQTPLGAGARAGAAAADPTAAPPFPCYGLAKAACQHTATPDRSRVPALPATLRGARRPPPGEAPGPLGRSRQTAPSPPPPRAAARDAPPGGRGHSYSPGTRSRRRGSGWGPARRSGLSPAAPIGLGELRRSRDPRRGGGPEQPRGGPAGGALPGVGRGELGQAKRPCPALPPSPRTPRPAAPRPPRAPRKARQPPCRPASPPRAGPGARRAREEEGLGGVGGRAPPAAPRTRAGRPTAAAGARRTWLQVMSWLLGASPTSAHSLLRKAGTPAPAAGSG